MNFLKQVLNAQIVATLIAMLLSTLLLNLKLIGEVTWAQVFLGSYSLFVAGGFLKDSWTAFLEKKGSP